MTCKLIGVVAICMVVRQRYLRYLQHLAHLLNPKTTLVAFTVSSLEAVIQGLISDLECEEALQVQSWLLALTRRVQLQELVMPLLYFTGFARCLNEEDFSEHLTQGAAVEGTTCIVVGIVMLVRLFTGPEISTQWRIFILWSVIVHVIAVALHLRHASKIMQMFQGDHDDKLEESELAFKGLDNAE